MAPPVKNREWIENGILPKGGIMLFGGDTGIGKTFIILNMIRSLVEGSNFLGTEWRVMDKPKSILYLDAEIGKDLLSNRVKKVFKGCENFGPGSVNAECDTGLIKLDTAAGRTKFYDKIKTCKVVPDVVVIDPLSYFLENGDNDNQVASSVYDGFRYAQQTFNRDMTFVLSHHYNKKPRGQGLDNFDPLDLHNFRGATKWSNIAWTVLTLNRTKDNNDEGWNLEARYAKIRAQKPISGTHYYRVHGDSLLVKPRTTPPVRRAGGDDIWG